MESEKEINNNYSVSNDTARCIELLKNLVSAQEQALAYLIEHNLDEYGYGEQFAEQMGEAVKSFGSMLGSKVYTKILRGSTNL